MVLGMGMGMAMGRMGGWRGMAGLMGLGRRLRMGIRMGRRGRGGFSGGDLFLWLYVLWVRVEDVMIYVVGSKEYREIALI